MHHPTSNVVRPFNLNIYIHETAHSKNSAGLVTRTTSLDPPGQISTGGNRLNLQLQTKLSCFSFFADCLKIIFGKEPFADKIEVGSFHQISAISSVSSDIFFKTCQHAILKRISALIQCLIASK
ncbi:hypothetical protein ACJX0J_026008 [Zea mays]